jgi:hypothetical protein
MSSYASCNTTALLFVAGSFSLIPNKMSLAQMMDGIIVAQAVFYSLSSTRTLVSSQGHPLLYRGLMGLCALTFMVGNATVRYRHHATHLINHDIHHMHHTIPTVNFGD